ncbi:hydrolase Nlp/P60 [Cloacibacterium rupense]|uniref:Hydrolase Nlp/P60 n=1 Tax=Cloacibacterium rupense TaxID=517423 RepID=A0ABQ2NJF3_9FLAO|nr:C40 family peptidase [Cloacibacterium rupense]GGP02740.1 hydrolase Nlp/P60 [Cloacibacterium rupense]
MEKYYCSVSVSPIRADISEKSEMTSQILYGETCEIIETEGLYSKIKMDFDGYEGWVNSSVLKKENSEISKNLVTQIYGVFDLPEGRNLLSLGSEVAFETENLIDKNNIRESLVETAKKFINVPYLWGGRSYFGIDCSALVQLVYKIHGVALPRDADKQAELGEARDFVEESEPGDLAFFEDETGFISHVGLVLSPFELIHASGKVRIDSLDFSGIYNAEKNKHTHKLRMVKTVI